MKDFRIFACLFGFLPQLFIKRVGGSPQINWDSNWNSVQDESNQWFPPGSASGSGSGNNRFSTGVTGLPWFPSPAAGTGTGAGVDFGEGPFVEGECLLTGCQAASDKNDYCTSKTFKFAHWRYPCSQPANAVNVRCCKEPSTFDPRPLKATSSAVRPRPTKRTTSRTSKSPTPTRTPVTVRATMAPTTRKPTATSPSSVRTTTAPAPLSSTPAPSVSPVPVPVPVRTSTTTIRTTVGNNNSEVITPPPAIDYFDYFQ